MQGRISRGILFPACLSMIGAITAVSVYNFWRIDRVQVNVESVNQFYVPVLKHLNLFSGKWSAYQRLFEQGVGFRRWGRGHHERVASKLRLKKMVEPNLGELKHRLEMIPANRMLAESASLRALLGHLESLASQEAGTLAEINGLVNARHLDEAAAAYAKARSEHLLLSQELFDVMHACEPRSSSSVESCRS